MTKRRATTKDLMTKASESVRRLNAELSRIAHATVATVEPAKRDMAPYGRCPHTGRAYRSKTEARWAETHRQHRYEALAIATPCGVYWPDFACGPNLYEVKGAYIRDRALHKVKAAIRPARELGFEGIWLAQWKDGGWKVTEVTEGAR